MSNPISIRQGVAAVRIRKCSSYMSPALPSKSIPGKLLRERRCYATSTSTRAASPETVSNHIVDLVQKYDYPNYLCTSFYPTKEARFDYLSLRALNVELSSIASSVSNAQLGRVRFQWWRDALSSLSSSSPQPHPTVLALSSSVRRNKLSTYHLTRLVDAKERNFLDPTYSSLGDLTAYAQSTQMALLSLQLQVLLSPAERRAADIEGIPLSTIDHALSHLATYIGVAQLLRGIHYFALQKRQIVVPRDIASAHGVVDEAVFRALPALQPQAQAQEASSAAAADPSQAQKAIAPLVEACSELAALADLERAKALWTLGLEPAQDEEHAALSQGRSLSRVPRSIAPLFLSAVPASSFLAQFAKTANFNPLHSLCAQQQARNWRLPLQIMWANYRGRF